MKKVYKDRLLKLAEHLEKGKLGHKKFDFAVYNCGEEDKRGCGTNGCAIGELPILFPRKWKFDFFGNPRLKIGSASEMADGKEFFNLDNDEYNHLFVPQYQTPHLFGGKYLGDNATRKQVAKNIRSFIRVKELEELE